MHVCMCEHVLYTYIECVYTLFQKLRGGAGSKQYGMDFSLSYEEKEENPRNYNGLRVRERENTFHITLNQRQLLSFGTVYVTDTGGLYM
jgi:hypothetical protein